MLVQPLVPWRSTLPWDMSSFGFAGQSITAACSVMLAGPALSAFAIFHSSECADVVNVLGGNGAVADEKVFCQGYRGDRGEPNRGIKGTLDHGNLLVCIAFGGRRRPP